MSQSFEDRFNTMETLLKEMIAERQGSALVDHQGQNLRDKQLPDALRNVPSTFRPAVYARERQPISQWADYLLPFSHLPPESRIVRTHKDTYAKGMALESCEEYLAGQTLLSLIVTGLAYAESVDPGFSTDPHVNYLVGILAGAIDGTLLSRLTLNRIKVTEGVKAANAIRMIDDSDLAANSSLCLQGLIAQFMSKKQDQETAVAAQVAIRSQNVNTESAK
ncbi:hypothetical protein H4R33_006806, partial [Dimargaris cristalligena]